MRNRLNLVLMIIAVCAGVARATDPVPVEYLWQSEPKLDFSWALADTTPNIHLNAKQLGSNYANERMRAAQSILRVPDSPTLNRQELLAATVARLEAGESDPNVRSELVAAACELDDGKHADLFWKIGKGDRVIQPVVESACIRWHKSQPLVDWRARLKETSASQSQLLLAVDGISVTGSPEDIVALKAMVLDETLPDTIRLSAARGVGNLSHDSQLELAQQLMKSPSAIRELLAASVITQSPVESVGALVQQLAQKSSSTAERVAYQWLCRHQPQVAQASASERLKHADSQIRSLAIDQLLALDNQETLPGLISALDDVHPKLREQARLKILNFADQSPQKLESVYQQLPQLLASESWRPVEHGIRLTVELNRPEHVPQLLKLLDHPRSEVCITAGWSLRHLATDETSLKVMFDHLGVWVERLIDPKPHTFEERDLRRMAHLFEAMGLRNYQPAKPMLMIFVPKDPNKGLITRMTAIWACGRLWQKSENKQLTDELEARIADKTSMFPESASVRFMCTVALGYVADPTTRGSLVRWNEQAPSPIYYATEWALKQIDAR